MAKGILSDRRTKRHYEHEIVHPAVARWLDQKGYNYSQQVKMPIHGKADFIARKPHRLQDLIVECKIDAAQVSRAIFQVKGYQHQHDSITEVAVAFPSHTITNKTKELCSKHDVSLIGVDVLGFDAYDMARPEIKLLDDLVDSLLSKRNEWGNLTEDILFILFMMDCPKADQFKKQFAKIAYAEWAADTNHAIMRSIGEFSDPDLQQPDNWNDITGGHHDR